jgi:hypothetical protein
MRHGINRAGATRQMGGVVRTEKLLYTRTMKEPRVVLMAKKRVS